MDSAQTPLSYHARNLIKFLTKRMRQAETTRVDVGDFEVCKRCGLNGGILLKVQKELTRAKLLSVHRYSSGARYEVLAALLNEVSHKGDHNHHRMRSAS